jgi:hypothetical protein
MKTRGERMKDMPEDARHQGKHIETGIWPACNSAKFGTFLAGRPRHGGPSYASCWAGLRRKMGPW